MKTTILPARLALGLCISAAAFGTPIPFVGSATMVAHFRVSNSAVARDGNGYVTSWTADNNPGIVLNAAGTTASNIVYNATGMNGAPVIETSDTPVTNQYLTGTLPGALTSTTIFWLGYYHPSRNGSTGDNAGQYVYSIGVDGADGSQMDHQTDDGVFQLYGGAGTQAGSSIASLEGLYTVWRTQYGEGVGNGHSAFANNSSIMSGSNGGSYNATGNLVVFGFQGTTPGVSSGFNFVGNMAELIIYNGILSAGDTAAVEAYLASRIGGNLGDPDPGEVPEPSTWLMSAAALIAIAGMRRRR